MSVVYLSVVFLVVVIVIVVVVLRKSLSGLTEGMLVNDQGFYSIFCISLSEGLFFSFLT